MRGTILLMSHKYKMPSAIVAGVALLLAVVVWKTKAAFIPGLTWPIHVLFCLWLAFASLLGVATSKEKVEDERVKAIRARAMMRGFIFTCVVILAFSVNVSLFPVIAPDAFVDVTFTRDDYSYMGMLLMAFPAFSIISYLVIFHYGLYNDENWDFNDELTPATNLKKNRKYILLKFLFWLLLLVLYIVLKKFL